MLLGDDIVVAKKKKSKIKYRICVFLPLCIFLLITIFTLIGSYWLEIVDKYQEKKVLSNDIITLKEKEESLKVDVDRLEDPDYVARYAREKYMYSKDGEIILRLPEEDE